MAGNNFERGAHGKAQRVGDKWVIVDDEQQRLFRQWGSRYVDHGSGVIDPEQGLAHYSTNLGCTFAANGAEGFRV